ncbi:MAG: hypothetical protein MHPDNHAH_00715 [Anaerolineales bacterium]|nr:hypothetical protein [Anaerolineales bacterium]
MHLTDDQLNEYLDNETAERAQIESHLASCADCAARLTALQTLFAELDSLPEVELTRNLAARFASTGQLTPQLPRWLTLTATLQTVLALIALLLAAPFVTNLLPAIQFPSFADVLLQLQSQWALFFDTITTYQLPTLPQLPPLEISTFVLSLTLAGASLLWLVGNGLLLRKQIHN